MSRVKFFCFGTLSLARLFSLYSLIYFFLFRSFRNLAGGEGEHKITSFIRLFVCVSICLYAIPLNAKLNPICHLLALLGAHHILHVSRIRVNQVYNPLNAMLNPIFLLLALLGSHHILHVSRLRVNQVYNLLNAKLNPIFILLALLGTHHILHVSRIMVKRVINSPKKFPGFLWNTSSHENLRIKSLNNNGSCT